jgi:predicted small lipoprotein YifL
MRLGAALLVAGLLAGCGQSGPLYFPGQKPPSKSSSSSR